MSTNKIKSLERKSKMGWACYYQAQEKHHEQMSEMFQKLEALQIKQKEQDEIIPSFITNELLELKDKLKEEIECPICLDLLPAKSIKSSSCGHKYCGGCLSKIDNCALCKKKLYRKN